MAGDQRSSRGIPQRDPRSLGINRSNIQPVGRVSSERVQPIRPPVNVRGQAYTRSAPAQVIRLQRPVRNTAAAKKGKRRQMNRSAVRDYLLGLGVGLAVFGTIAAFICHALLEMMSL